MSNLQPVPQDVQPYLHGIGQSPTAPPVIKIDPKAKAPDRLMQGLNQGGVPILAPDGKPGFVHGSAVDSFLQANPTYKPGVVVTAPDGNPGLVARDQAGEFIKANPNYKLGQPETSVESNGPGIVGKAWNKLNAPVGDLVGGSGTSSQFAKAAIFQSLGLGQYFPGVNDEKTLSAPRLNDSPLKAGVRSFAAGAAADTGDLASSFTSPLALGTLGLGSAAKLPGVLGKAAPLLGRAAGLGFGGQGAATTYLAAAKKGPYAEADVPTRVGAGLQGASMALTGAATAPGTIEAAKGVPGLAKETGQAIVQSKAGQLIGQKATDIRSAINPQTAGPVESATMAFRPRNSKYKWQQEAQSALPDMRRAADNLGINVNEMTLQDAAKATSQAKRDVWKEYSEQFSDPNASDTVDTSPVGKVIRSTITTRMAEQNPGLAEKIDKVASTYEGRQLSLADIEDRMHELNNETSAIEARYPAQKMAAQSDPANAYIFAERQALRNLADSKMNELSGPGANQLRARYGALKSVEDVIQRRIPVAERQAPMPLSKLLIKPYALAKMVKGAATMNPWDIIEGGVALKSADAAAKLNDPNLMTQQAFAKTKPSGPIPPAVQRVSGEYVPNDYVSPRNRGIRGLLPGISLPAEFPPATNSVEAVGMPQTAEAQALQNRFNDNPNPFLRKTVAPQAVPEQAAPVQQSVAPQSVIKPSPSPVVPEAKAAPVRPSAGSPEYEALKARIAQLEKKAGVKAPEVASVKPMPQVAAAQVPKPAVTATSVRPVSQAAQTGSGNGSNPKLAERFRSLADGLEKQIDDRRRPMTQNPTPKRMAEYRSRIIDADEMASTQKALRALANAHEAGTVPKELAGLRSKDEIGNLVRKGLDGSKGGYYDRIQRQDYYDKSPSGTLLQGMIEKGSGETSEQKAVKDRASKISQLEAQVQFQPIAGYFPTPKPIVNQMLQKADIQPDMRVLEPSAGKGNIADAIREAVPTARLNVAEQSPKLQEILKLKEHNLVESDFLQHDSKYDRIVMNPPFEKGADMEHVQHAYKLLKPGGRIVSIMGPHFEFGGDKKSVAFRDWLDSVGGDTEKLPESSFKESGTGVASRMVTIDKPKGATE